MIKAGRGSCEARHVFSGVSEEADSLGRPWSAKGCVADVVVKGVMLHIEKVNSNEQHRLQQ